MKRAELVNTRFERLHVLRFVHSEGGRAHWHCRCDCGDERTYRATHLLSGRSTSCGCRKKEGSFNRTHGMKHTGTYRSWMSMHTRCTNPKSNRWGIYGGRGITICERWRSFENFFADMGERPEGTSLDRKDNDKGYEPGNCRWATPTEQSNNRRNVRQAA